MFSYKVSCGLKIILNEKSGSENMFYFIFSLFKKYLSYFYLKGRGTERGEAKRHSSNGRDS